MKKRTLVILGASSILALGIAAPVAAAAGDDPKSRHQQLASALAKELGVDESKVSDALDKLREEKKSDRPERTGENTNGQREGDLKTRLDATVKEGKLTQAEADAVLKAADAGVIGGHWSGGHRGESK